MRKWVLVFVWVVMTWSPPPARAWNETGHMIVAEIAWRQLNERQRQQVGELLAQHPHYQKLLLARKPDASLRVSDAEWAFLRSSVWPDLVRPARPGMEGELYKTRDITDYHRGPWHYTSIPWTMPTTRPSTGPA